MKKGDIVKLKPETYENFFLKNPFLYDYREPADRKILPKDTLFIVIIKYGAKVWITTLDDNPFGIFDEDLLELATENEVENFRGLIFTAKLGIL